MVGNIDAALTNDGAVFQSRCCHWIEQKVVDAPATVFGSGLASV